MLNCHFSGQWVLSYRICGVSLYFSSRCSFILELPNIENWTPDSQNRKKIVGLYIELETTLIAGSGFNYFGIRIERDRRLI